MRQWPRAEWRAAPSALACAALVCALGCVPLGSYGSVARYPSPDPESSAEPEPVLLSAQVSAFGEARPPLAEAAGPRMVEASEAALDRLVLVFRYELDAATVDPRAFAISRGDGRRVRPVRAVLAPANESDENRSLTLLGHFGSAETPPVAIHVIGRLYAESGEDLYGLDAQISGPEQPDRALLVERLAPAPGRCADARQVVRVYWSDRLGPSEAQLLARVELLFADGQRAHPIALDDHGDQGDHGDHGDQGEGSDEGMVPAQLVVREQDNVLDLCVDRETTVVHLHIAAGALRDASGHASAGVELDLPPLLPAAVASPADPPSGSPSDSPPD